MLIIGAKGFAKEVLQALVIENSFDGELYFYDDINDDVKGYLYNRYRIIKNIKEINELLGYSFDFNVGIGNPTLRQNIVTKFTGIGGKLRSIISTYARIGSFDNEIGEGANIMAGTIITNSIKIGIAPLINLNCTIGHDCIIGDYLEMSPGTHISGYCVLGHHVNLGTNATVLPKINIGNNVIIGANSVVTKHIPDNSLAIGVPAKVIKDLPPLAI